MTLSAQTRGDGSAKAVPVTLPARYQAQWDAPFRSAIEARLAPGIAILDVGSGRNPTIPAGERPEGTRYVGLDLSKDELDAAAPESYDETVASDAGTLQDDLVRQFDLIVSWQVFEHVEDLGAAMVCMRSYLRDGGAIVALFSGSRSAFALINRVLPFHIGAPIVTRVMGRSSSNPVFPAYYDRCTASALQHMLESWSTVRVVPYFRGAEYFRFSSVATRAYLAYENRAAARNSADLATHYLLIAER